MCEAVRLEVCGLGKSFVAVVEGTDIWAVSCVDSNMGPQVKVQRETLATSFKRALEVLRGFLILCALIMERMV